MPIEVMLAADGAGTRYGRADNFLEFALYDGKNCASAVFARGQFPASGGPNSSGNTIETTRAHRAPKSTLFAATPKAADAI